MLSSSIYVGSGGCAGGHEDIDGGTRMEMRRDTTTTSIGISGGGMRIEDPSYPVQVQVWLCEYGPSAGGPCFICRVRWGVACLETILSVFAVPSAIFFLLTLFKTGELTGPAWLGVIQFLYICITISCFLAVYLSKRSNRKHRRARLEVNRPSAAEQAL
jgi:hypothetical protein